MPRRRTVLDVHNDDSIRKDSLADGSTGELHGNNSAQEPASSCCGCASSGPSNVWQLIIGALLVGTVLVIRVALDRSMTSSSLAVNKNRFEIAAAQVSDFVADAVNGHGGYSAQDDEDDNDETPAAVAAAAVATTPAVSNADSRGYGYYSPQRQPKLDTVGLSGVVWLASHPYSGSHLVRRLVESATLQPTYSMYNEEGTLAKKFEGLDLPVRTSKDVEKYIQEKIGIRNYDTRTACDPVVVKTHLPFSPYALTWQEAFPHWAMEHGVDNRIIRLVRNPWDQVLRMIFKASSEDGSPPEERVRAAARNYMKFHHYWEQAEKEANARRPQLSAKGSFHAGSCQHSEVRQQQQQHQQQQRRKSLVVRYEDLCTDLDSAVVQILEFLGVEDASDMVSSTAAQNTRAVYLQRAIRIERPTDAAKHIGKHSFSKEVPEGEVWFTPRIFHIINETCWPVIQRYGYTDIVPPQWRAGASKQTADLR